VLATPLYDDLAAELHEDASARLREHLALLGCSTCAGPRPASGVSGYQDPTGGHEEDAVANHRERPASRGTALPDAGPVACRWGRRADPGNASLGAGYPWPWSNKRQPAGALTRHRLHGCQPVGMLPSELPCVYISKATHSSLRPASDAGTWSGLRTDR
jgi:hypothetical protein